MRTKEQQKEVDYWEKQEKKIALLSKDFNMVIITNEPNRFNNTQNVELIKFSKSFNVLRERINEKSSLF